MLITNEKLSDNLYKKFWIFYKYLHVVSCSSDTPVFVQVQQRWRRLYFGICMGNGFRASYEMAQMKKTPQQCQNLTGLLDVFKSKLVSLQQFLATF